jgi:preprotein translocase subunit SecD
MKNVLLALALCLVTIAAVAADSTKQSVLQFRLVVENPTANSEQMILQRKNNKEADKTFKETLNVQKASLLDQTALKSATVKTNIFTTQIEIKFTAEGQKKFAKVTSQNIGNRLAIVINGKLISAPRIQDEISDGICEIAANFSKQDADELAKQINDAIAK